MIIVSATLGSRDLETVSFVNTVFFIEVIRGIRIRGLFLDTALTVLNNLKRKQTYFT